MRNYNETAEVPFKEKINKEYPGNTFLISQFFNANCRK